MTTPTPTQTAPAEAPPEDEFPAELVALIAAAAAALAAIWAALATAQAAFLAALADIPSGRSRGAAQRTRRAAAAFNTAVAAFDRDARAFAERWAAQDLPRAYRDGAIRALREAGVPVDRFDWGEDHQAAITGLSATFWGDLVRRIGETVRRAQAFARDALAASRRPEGVDPGALTQRHPLDRVIYGNDARHPADAWARAALSWQAVAAANNGAVRAALVELGCEWVQVRDGTGCGWREHEDADQADGTLRTIQDALAHPAAHPACVRQFSPRPDLTGRTDLQSGDPA